MPTDAEKLRHLQRANKLHQGIESHLRRENELQRRIESQLRAEIAQLRECAVTLKAVVKQIDAAVWNHRTNWHGRLGPAMDPHTDGVQNETTIYVSKQLAKLIDGEK